MSEVIDINAKKQQRERDEAELRSVQEMTDQCYRSPLPIVTGKHLAG